MSGFTITGEVRGIKDRIFDYKDSNGSAQKGREVAVYIETAPGDVHEVKLLRDQLAASMHDRFAGLKGKTISLPVDVSLKKGYLNIYLSAGFAFPVAPSAAPAPAAAVGSK